MEILIMTGSMTGSTAQLPTELAQETPWPRKVDLPAPPWMSMRGVAVRVTLRSGRGR
ncbi:hypothetical protein [Mycolicibacterium diernhoferi]|uniref:hypothetical protein n=1 Tax=Mycolicibacterium diernhoferi TaxID=1801 RepID=UPI0013F5F463|nr:hypothetical protein [Mycolicibacterium diernhoferi]QYL23763.1 hypothetical protein K0O62_05535 [Mycolicibacterium diernhoferi]